MLELLQYQVEAYKNGYHTPDTEVRRINSYERRSRGSTDYPNNEIMS